MVAQRRIKKRFIPVYSGVVVQPIPVEESPGGILYPDSLKKGMMGGEVPDYDARLAWVIAVGPDVKHVKDGDLVILGNYPMHMVRYEGDEYALTKEEYLYGVVMREKVEKEEVW